MQKLPHQLGCALCSCDRRLSKWRRCLWAHSDAHELHVSLIELHELLHHERRGANLRVLRGLRIDCGDADAQTTTDEVERELEKEGDKLAHILAKCHVLLPAWAVLLVKFQYTRSEEHTSELQSQSNLVCRLLLEKKK